jgi:hypothetical protein
MRLSPSHFSPVTRLWFNVADRMNGSAKAPKRRWWRQPFFRLVLIVVPGCLGLNFWLGSRLSAKAQQIRLGQTEAEVLAIMGRADIMSSHPHSPVIGTLRYGSIQGFWDGQIAYRLATTIYRGRKCPFWLSGNRYPIEIAFDLDGRVNSVRINRSTVKKQP